jgi:two-component system NtrC family sensor kinase
MIKIINSKWMNLKIKTRLSIVVSVHFIIIYIIIFMVIWNISKKNYINVIFTQQQELVKSAASFIDTEIYESQKYLIKISEQMPVDRIDDENYIQNFILEFPKTHPGIDLFFDRGLFILSKSGKLIGEYPYATDVHGRDYSFREYYSNTLSSLKPYISKPYIGTREPAKPIIQFTVPLFSKNGDLCGILLGAITLEKDLILKKLSDLKVGNKGYFYIFNDDRVIIHHPDKSRIMKQDVPYGVNKIFDKAIDGFEGSMEITNSRGKYFLTTVRRLKSTGWIIASNYSSEEAYLPLQNLVKYLIIIMTILGIISISMILLLMSFQLNPLIRLNNAISKMGKDIFSVTELKINSHDEVGILTGSFNEMLNLIKLKTRELKNANDNLLRLSTTDPLTGLYNRRQVERILKEEIERAKRYNSPLCLMALDIDFFKHINDTYGHMTGDDIIKHLSLILMESIRMCDIAGRTGGEEFIIILPSTDISNTGVISERIRMKIENSHFEFRIKYTCSIGVAKFKDESYDDLLTKVDNLLYEAKRTGRNKVVTENN